MTEPTPPSESLPSPDGLPRRAKPVARTRKPTAADLAAEAEMQAAADALVAEIVAEGGDPDLAEVSEAVVPTEPEPEPKLSPLEIARRIVDAAEDKKAADIVLLDVTALTSMADYFVVCSGGSERQLGAIADGVTEKLRDEGVRPIGREGGAGSHWTLLDYGSVIVHVFAPPERDYYQLERLWSKAKTVIRVQ